MPLDPKDLVLLDDLRAAAGEASAFVAGMAEQQFYKDRKTQKAVEREFEIMGEAARSLSDAARQAFPHVPFKAIIGMRNILAHDYGRVDPKELWATVHGSLPTLMSQLKKP